MTEWATRQATAAEGRREVTAATAGPAQVTSFVTAGGIRVRRTAEPFDPARIDDITRQVESRRGAVLSSGMEYPGRYSRWHVAYTDPFAEVVGCEDRHLGLCGAFGYDLAFQFEPVRLRRERPASQRDLVLHIPDRVWAIDRKR